MNGSALVEILGPHDPLMEDGKAPEHARPYGSLDTSATRDPERAGVEVGVSLPQGTDLRGKNGLISGRLKSFSRHTPDQ
jgi:hypothetical protein